MREHVERKDIPSSKNSNLRLRLIWLAGQAHFSSRTSFPAESSSNTRPMASLSTPVETVVTPGQKIGSRKSSSASNSPFSQVSPASSVSTASTATSSACGEEEVIVEVKSGPIDLLQYVGREAVQNASDLIGDPCIEIMPRGLEPRIYFLGAGTSITSVDFLKSKIIESARKSGIHLNANFRSKSRTIQFYCRDGIDSRKGACSLKFHIRLDSQKNQWYIKVGSGCPRHSVHRPTAESSPTESAPVLKKEIEQSSTINAVQKRKRRRKEKECMQNVALEKFGLTNSDFNGDVAAYNIAAAAAVAASAVPSSVDPFISSGRCYLLPPVIEYRPNDIMVTCSCEAHASKHFWVGPKPDGMDELIAKLCASCGFNDEGDEADKCSSGDGEMVCSPRDTKALQVPTEHGINGQVKRVDKDISEKFNSDKPFYAIKICKPSKAKKAETTRGSNKKYQFLSISGFPANTNPVASCSRLKISNNTDLIMQNDIIEAGKKLFASRWVEDAETRRKGSSSKYYTLLLHDHNAKSGILESGLSSIYFRPMENTKYWWLSYLTTREGTLTERKGFGSMMMWRFINMARRAEGVEEIWLEVRPELKGARALYAELGFVEVDWNDFPKEIEDYVMVSPDLTYSILRQRQRIGSANTQTNSY